MKLIQNNYTTPEQSKKLLKLGVPRWTADEYRDKKGFRHSLEGILDKELYFQNFSESTPCWSVGRLIEIFFKSSKYTYILLYPQFNQMDYLMSLFEEKIKAHKLDFSKLEE